MKPLAIVTATSKTKEEFQETSLLARSAPLILADPANSLHFKASNIGDNLEGLGAYYNKFLVPQFANHLVLFVHDDVLIDDWLVRYRLNEAIEQFDVVGVAGNMEPDLTQPSWGLKCGPDGKFQGWQNPATLSGIVGHDKNGRIYASKYGEVPAETPLIDGLFIAVNTERILATGATFDPQFDFHFYDLDFCRTCLGKGLKIGTWPIAVTHGGKGDFKSPEWRQRRELYEQKWK